MLIQRLILKVSQLKIVKLLFGFGMVGIITTSTAITLYFLLLERMELPIYPVYIGVNIITTCLSYLLNTIFTFKEKITLKSSFRYYVTYGIGLTIGLILLTVFKLIFPYSSFVLVLLTILPRIAITFYLVNKFVYK